MFTDDIKDTHIGQTAYIVGKGPSLNYLTKTMVKEGLVITLNQAIIKVEELELPNSIYSLQKDQFTVPVKESTTLILHKHESVKTIGKPKLSYLEFDAKEMGFPIDTFSAIIAIKMAEIMGCVKFVFISFDSCTTGDVTTFDTSKPYFPKAYVTQATKMKEYVKNLNCEWITPKRKPIALITPTGGRPEQIKHCMGFMKNQTYSGPVIWILVDDCYPTTVNTVPEDFREDWTIVKFYPFPIWKEGDNTQARNLKAGIEEVKKYDVDAVFIIEDDDYYTPKYLSVMTAALKGFDVVGEIQTVYYNVQLKSERRCVNTKHSSLFQTAFTPKMISLFEEVLTYQEKYIDISFFKEAKNIQFLKGLNLSVGIKGLPGRGGIGNGHNSSMYRDKHEKVLPENLRNTIKETYKL